MASANFTAITRSFIKGEIDFDTITCKVMLLSAVPSASNLDTWVNRTDVTTEITGTGYTAGGIAQAFTLPALDTTNNRQAVNYTDISAGWTSATFNCAAAVIYVDTGSASTDKLLHMLDLGSQTVTAASFGITYDTPFYLTSV